MASKVGGIAVAMVIVLLVSCGQPPPPPSLWSIKDGAVIEIGYFINGRYPQIFALHKNDGAMRLTYLPDGSWGTSVYPLGYWHDGYYIKGITINKFDYSEQGSNLVLELTDMLGRPAKKVM